LLLRIRKRHTSTEDVDAFCDAEFQDANSGGLDHRISVYQIKEPSLVQCHAEHYAANNLTPKGRDNLDLAGLAAVESMPLPPQEWPFSLSGSAHCEIPCASDDDVRSLAGQLLESLGARTRPVAKADMAAYVRAAVGQADAEWTAYLGRADVKPAWKALAGE